MVFFINGVNDVTEKKLRSVERTNNRQPILVWFEICRLWWMLGSCMILSAINRMNKLIDWIICACVIARYTKCGQFMRLDHDLDNKYSRPISNTFGDSNRRPAWTRITNRFSSAFHTRQLFVYFLRRRPTLAHHFSFFVRTRKNKQTNYKVDGYRMRKSMSKKVD